MPIHVDYEQQRRRVTALAARLVAREGVAALTFRGLAKEAGTSTAIVSTYFTDKSDLLRATLGAAAERTTLRFEAAAQAGGGLQGCLEAWLPLDAERLEDWRVVIAFWGVAVADGELAAVQDGHVSRARGRVERILRERSGPDGEKDLAMRAHQVVALTLGLACQAVFQPIPAADPDHQQRLLADGLGRLAPSARTGEPGGAGAVGVDLTAG